MPTATAPPTDRTWRSWLRAGEPEPPEDELLTRAEFVAALQELYPFIEETTVATWERAGALPRPVRRWHHGATRALYPRWLINYALLVPEFRAGWRISLAEIGETL